MKKKTITIKQYEWGAFFGGLVILIGTILGELCIDTIGRVFIALAGLVGLLISIEILAEPDEYEVEVKNDGR